MVYLTLGPFDTKVCATVKFEGRNMVYLTLGHSIPRFSGNCYNWVTVRIAKPRSKYWVKMVLPLTFNHFQPILKGFSGYLFTPNSFVSDLVRTTRNYYLVDPASNICLF